MAGNGNIELELANNSVQICDAVNYATTSLYFAYIYCIFIAFLLHIYCIIFLICILCTCFAFCACICFVYFLLAGLQAKPVCCSDWWPYITLQVFSVCTKKLEQSLQQSWYSLITLAGSLSQPWVGRLLLSWASKPQNISSLLPFASLHRGSGNSLQKPCTICDIHLDLHNMQNMLHIHFLLFMQDIAESCNSHST